MVGDKTSHCATTARCPSFCRLFMLALIVHVKDFVHQLATMFKLFQLLLVLLEALDELLVVLVKAEQL